MITTSSASRILVIFIAGISLITGCSTFDADYERDNSMDPKSTNFIHSNPEQFTVEIEDGVINIRWEDVSQYNNGYIVEKAIDDSTRFERVAILPDDAEHFKDPGKQIGLTVYYKISSFVDEDDDEKIVHSEILELSIQAIETYDGISSDSNLIKLSWETEQEFSDGVIIQEKRQRQSEFTAVEIIDFADQESTGGNYEYRSDLETFNLDVRLTAFQYQEGEIVPIQHLDKSLSINDPENFNITFINELETHVEWENSVDFADHYLLTVKHEQSGTVQRYELLPDEFSQVVNMEMKKGRSRYTLFGVLEDEQSSPLNERKSFTVKLPMLSYTSTSLSAITLNFEDRSDEPPRYSAIIVERSVNDGEFEKYEELPVSQSEYTDTNLQPSNSYSYRIRTLTTGGHEEIELTSENRFVRVDEANISYTGLVTSDNNIHLQDPNTLIFYKDYYYADGNTSVEIIDTNNLNERIEFDSGNRFYRSQVSNLGDKIVEFVDGGGYGEYDLNIWDLNTKSIIGTIPQAHTETGFTNVNAILGFSRDGNLIASAISNLQNTEIKIWNTQTSNLLHTIDIPNERLHTFAFNPAKNELIISTDLDLYIYETNTFQVIAHYENLFGNYWFNYKISGDGKRVYLYQGRRLKLFDLETKSFVRENEFELNIESLSTNYDGTEILIKVEDWTGIYDADSFELNYRIKWHYDNSFKDVMMLNPQKNGSAFSFKLVPPPDPHTDMFKWERRDVWYMEPIRQ